MTPKQQRHLLKKNGYICRYIKDVYPCKCHDGVVGWRWELGKEVFWDSLTREDATAEVLDSDNDDDRAEKSNER